MGSFFTPAERQQTLDKIIATLKEDGRVAGAIVVGSGAAGFSDEYSDIDICVPVFQAQDSSIIFSEWPGRMQSMFSVIHRFEVIPAFYTFLYGFLLEGFLEVDISFVPLDQLTARRAIWKVAFDRTGTIEETMRSSWDSREEPDGSGVYIRQIGDIWYFVMHVLVSLRRGLPWRALGCLQEIRKATLLLAELNYKKEVRFSRQVDEMPAEFLRQVERTLVARADTEDIREALAVAVECFFDQAEALSVVYGDHGMANLRDRMRELMGIFGEREQNAGGISPEEKAV